MIYNHVIEVFKPPGESRKGIRRIMQLKVVDSSIYSFLKNIMGLIREYNILEQL